MGNNYSNLSTNDPYEPGFNKPSESATSQNGGAPRFAARFSTANPTVSLKINRSTSVFMEKHPSIRPAVHMDAVGILTPVRPGMVISGGRDKLIAVNNIDKGECIYKWYGHQKEVTKLIYKNANGKHFVLSGSRDKTVKLWKFNRPTAMKTFEGHQMAVMGVAALNDINCVSGSRDATLKLWDIETGKNIQTKEHSRNIVTHISYNKMRDLLAQTSEDKQLKIWDPNELKLVHQFPNKNHILNHCDFSTDGNFCIASSSGCNGDGCEITLYDLRQQKILREFRGHEEAVNCAIYLPQQMLQKNLMLSVSSDHSVKVWDLNHGNCLVSQVAPVNADLLSCVAFNDGNIVVSGLNASLCHYLLTVSAARPFLQCVSFQSRPTQSKSEYLTDD